MIRIASLVASLALLAMSSACNAGPPSQPLPMRLVKDIPLGQSTRRYDYESFDPRTGLLFLGDLAGGRVLVIDPKAGKLVKAIPAVDGAHGVLAVPEQGRVYASATSKDEVATIDEATLSVIARVPAGYHPDGIAWMPALNKLYVSDEHGQTVGVIDAATNRLVTKIAIKGDVGNTQYDTADRLIYSNDQTANTLVSIDPQRDAIVDRWPLAGCRGAHGLLIDPSRQLAYIACEDNSRLVTFSLREHKVLDVQPTGSDPDVMAADFGLKRLYVAGESGVVSAFNISADVPRKIGEAKIADNAHVVAVDQGTHHVFFPLRDVDGKPVLRVMEPS